MLEINHVYNMDCIEGMKKMGEHSVDIVLTSPPYNTGRNSGSMENHEKDTTYTLKENKTI